MERFDASQLRLWRLSRWQTWLLVAIAIAIGFAITLLGAIVVVVLTPLFLIAAVAVKLLVRNAEKRAGLAFGDVDYWNYLWLDK